MITKPGTYDLEITSSTLGYSRAGKPLWQLAGRVITDGEHHNETCAQSYALPDVTYTRDARDIVAAEARNVNCIKRIQCVFTALDLLIEPNGAAFEAAVGRKLTVDLKLLPLPNPDGLAREFIAWTNERLWRDWDARVAEMTTLQLEEEYKKQFADAERLMNEADEAAVRARLVRERLVKLRSVAA